MASTASVVQNGTLDPRRCDLPSAIPCGIWAAPLGRAFRCCVICDVICDGGIGGSGVHGLRAVSGRLEGRMSDI